MPPLAAFVLSLTAVIALVFTVGRRRRVGMYRDWLAPANDPTPIDDIAAWVRDDVQSGRTAGAVHERTWNDLEGDGLFRALDHTDTPLGRQTLYALLREPSDSARRRLLDTLATALGGLDVTRERVRAALRDHRGTGGYRLHRLLRDRRLTPTWSLAAPVIAVSLVCMAVMLPLYPRLLIAMVPMAFVGLTVRLFGLSRLGPYIGPLRELAPVLRSAERLAAVAETMPLAPEEREALLAALRPAGVPLARLARITRVVRPEFSLADEILASMYEYVNLVLLLDVNALLFTSRTLAAHQASLEKLCRTVGLFDAACSLAAFRATRTWCRPVFVGRDALLSFDALQHPALAVGVTNDVKIRAGEGLLLTGANMSGKSTLLRAIGCNVLLARALGTCTATSASLSDTAVYTSIGHADDLSQGVSYFYAEARAVAELLQLAEQEHALFLFDELFRGTNAAERVAAAEAVLRAIVTGNGRILPQRVAIATHDLQLGDLLADCFRTMHLLVESEGSTLRFRYRLQPGPATTRTALTLLEQCGVRDAILEAARRRAAALEDGTPLRSRVPGHIFTA